MASTVALNVKNLADLNLIIERYEKIDPQKDGIEVVTKSYKLFDGLQLNLETLKKTLGVEEEYKKLKQDLQKNIDNSVNSVFDANNQNSVTKQYNDFFENLYKPGSTVKRDFDVPLNDNITLKAGGTLGGLLNSKSFEEGLGVLLNDCIPCSSRLTSFKFQPDLSFLDSIIKQITDMVAAIQNIALTITDTGPFKGQFCATLNMFQFTCLPDLQAIDFSLKKSLQLNMKLPAIKLPGLTDLILFIFFPILSSLVNLVYYWLGAVLKPVKCAVESIKKQISKLQIRTKGFDASLALGIDVGPLKGNTNIKNQAFSNFVKGIDNTAQIQSLIKGLTNIADFLNRIESEVKAFIQKNIVSKFEGAMNTSTKAVQSLSVWIVKIQEILNFILMFSSLKNIFFTEFQKCKDKDTAFENAKEKATDSIEKIFGNKSNIEVEKAPDNYGVLATNTVFKLTEKELKALNFREAFRDRLKLEEQNTLNSGEVEYIVKIRDDISFIKDCSNTISFL